MKIIKDPLVLQKELNGKKSIGFIPTMGALHNGHLSLIKMSQKENKYTVVSLFLNPTQFNNSNDLKTYPSSLEEDIQILKSFSVDYVFMPEASSIYFDNYRFQVEEKEFSNELCGKDRPGHFTGVLTVVMKLLNIVNPDKAYFGEKDYQQLNLIKDMVSAFFMKVEIISGPTVRDDNGLALSSRNRRLNTEALKKAHIFAKKLKQKEIKINDLQQELEQNGIEVDYLEEKFNRRFAAVKINDVRLIDNVPL